MSKRTQNTGRAEYAQALREQAAAQREAAAALAALTAAKEKLAPASPDAPRRGRARATTAARAEIAALEKRLATAQRTLDEIANRAADARGRALGGESGFEQLSAAHPLLLLPVRLETRFAWMNGGRYGFEVDPALEQVLLVRIYPDEIHEDSHEPELLPNEARWIGAFRRRVLVASDNRDVEAAWAELIARAGATRAAWLGHVAMSHINPGKRLASFSRPSLARLLPDRWAAYTTLADGTTLTALSQPVREPLEIGLSTAGTDWMVNFDAALKVGMALVVRAIPTAATEIRRLIVVGARSTLDPAQTQTELEQLFDAHHYTRGLGFVAPGTATNSSPGTRAGFSTRPPVAEVVAIESRRYGVGGRTSPLCQRGDQSDGTALADALGIEPAVFAFAARADSTDQLDALHMRQILTAATKRPLTLLLKDILDASTVGELLIFAIERVSALGPLPCLRVGGQPYSVLPVMLTDGVRFDPASSAGRYLPALNRLRALWQSAASGLDWVGKNGADPGTTLIRILQRDGVARRIAFRPLLGPDAGAALHAGIGGRIGDIMREQRDAAAAAIDALGARGSANAGLLNTMLLPIAPALTDPVVEAEDAPHGSVQRAAGYLEVAAALRPESLLQHAYAGDRPRALFFAVARLAMLELADEVARELLIADNKNPSRWDDENPPAYNVDPFGTPLRRLEAGDPADPIAPIGFHLSELGARAGVLGTMREALRHFKTRTPALIELQLRAGLGLFSNRLDAWYTALAMEQLLGLRNDINTQAGINAGAYGVLEHITRAPRQPVGGNPGLFSQPTNGGYVHAPSVNHGAAAAVLRSVHLAHAASAVSTPQRPARGAAFSVDLSSERVRRALPLLEGIRAGQPLAALLGYRLERELAAERLQRFIAPFRAIAPLLANTLTPSNLPAEVVAASNVVDGLTLLEKGGYDGDQPASVDLLWLQNGAALGPTLGPDELAAMKRVFASAQDAVDAVADLVLAEGVFQAVQGNPVRTGAALDSLSGAPVPPAEMQVVRTPRSGVAATHRVLAVLEADAMPPTGWALTPRARFEPRLETWAASQLPDPAHIFLRAQFRDADGNVVGTLEDLTLADLFAEARNAQLDHLQLGALDVVSQADPRDTPQRSALEVRLTALLEIERPPDLDDAALELVYERPRHWDAATFGVVETLEIAAQLRNLIGRARPLAPEDFATPGQASSLRIETAEHLQRAQDAAQELTDVRAFLEASRAGNDAGLLRVALFSADAFGVAGAVPVSLRDVAGTRPQAKLVTQLRAQAEAVLAELKRRERRVTEAAAGDPPARLKAVFGDGFVTLPVMTDVSGGPIAFGSVPNGATAAAKRTWLGRAARVRESVALLDGALGAAEAVARTRKKLVLPLLEVRQLGAAAGEPWIALPLAAGATLPGGRISLFTITTGAPVAKALAGLFIDEWLEVVPSKEETTSVAFHFEAPSSSPPQVMVLGVPAPGVARWTADAAQRLVAEALDLAKIRLVDMDEIPGLGQLLPAFVTAENTAGEITALDVETLTRAGGP